MRLAVGALLWRQSSEAHGDQLDMHIAVTHLLPPEYSPTGGAIALSVAVVKPDSRGTIRLRSRDPREQPEIDCNFLAQDRDARRMLEGVKLACRIGRNPALAQFLQLELMPGDGVGDDQLADVVASNLAFYGHPTATAPMGGPEDPWAVVDSHGAVNGIDGLRVVDASIMPVVVSVALNPTTIMIAERSRRWSTQASLGEAPGRCILGCSDPTPSGCAIRQSGGLLSTAAIRDSREPVRETSTAAKSSVRTPAVI